MIINGTALVEAAPIKNMMTTKERCSGVSHGLAEAGYDIRIKQDIWFVPGPSRFYAPLHADDFAIAPLLSQEEALVPVNTIRIAERSVVVADKNCGPYDIQKGRFTIASAIEEFHMPQDLVGVVHDKSTWARHGLSVFNTVIEPGWKGFLTLELVYHGNDVLHIPAGCGIAQILFSRIANEGSYDGKYQNQDDRPVAAIMR